MARALLLRRRPTATGSATASAPTRADGDPGPRVGDGHGLKEAVSSTSATIDAREVNSIPIGADRDGGAVVVRVGRYGPYLQRGEERASVPEDLAPDELTLERAEELLAAPSGDRSSATDPETGLPVIVRAGSVRAVRPARRGRPGRRASRGPPRCSSRCRSTR